MTDYKKNNFKKCLKWLMALLFVVSTSNITSAENLSGRWIKHPGASLRSAVKESQVDRIIDGERYVYFSVRGNYFSLGDSGLAEANTYCSEQKVDPLRLFRYDKKLPWSDDNIRPLAQEVETSGNFNYVAEYCPEAGVLAVVYDNNAIDFIFDNGDLVKSNALADASIPNSVSPYSVTFDPERSHVYLAGAFGFAIIDFTNGELVSIHKYPKISVSWAARVGSNIVLFAGNMDQKTYETKTYLFPEDKVPATLDNPILGADNLQALMPLSSSTFAAVAKGATDNQRSLHLFTVANNSLQKETLVSQMTVDNAALWRYRHFFSTDGFVLPTKEGYSIHSKENIYFLRKKVDKAELLSSIPKNALSANDASSKSACYDGSTVWFYTYDDPGNNNTAKRGFYSRNYSNNTWGAKSEVAFPVAPTSDFACYGEWSPLHGVIFRGPGTLFNTQDLDIDNLFAYKDGKWSDLSFAANNPTYNLPTNYANNVGVDPLNPNWIWGCTNRAGLHRIDLSDYNNFLAFGSKNYSSYVTRYPGYFDIFEPQRDVWSVIIAFSNVDFDNKGNMWFARYWMTADKDTDYETYANTRIPLYYLTPEERNQIANIGSDASKLPDFQSRELVMERTSLQHRPKIIACKAPANENIIVVTSAYYTGQDRCMAVYDHNGTPEDPSDDRYALAYGAYNNEGTPIIYMEETGIYEDPKTGEIWLFTDSGPYVFNPRDYLDGNHEMRRPSISNNNGIYAEENPLNQIVVKYITDDLLGRKWVASEMGLYCLSADGKELLGHYTTENSPLPSDDVRNVVCDRTNGSIFVLTAGGIAEFQPAGSTGVLAEGSHLSIWPSAITPDYNGYVNISGVVGGTAYEVYDEVGNLVKLLGEPSGNTLQWDGTDNDGQKVSKGRYSVKRRGMDESHPIIVM